MVIRWVIVEREPLLRAAMRVLTSAAGAPRGVLLIGVAGFGTSTLARAIADEVAARGAAVTHWPRLPDTGTSPEAARLNVVVVDDTSQLDAEADADLYRWLAAARNRRAIVAARRGVPIPQHVGEQWSNGAMVRIDIPPLTHLGVEAMASHLLGGPVTRGLNDHLVRASGGSPLLVRELIGDGIQDGTIALAGTAWVLRGTGLRVGPRLRDLIRTRLDTLPPPEREALELVACSGGAPVRMLLQLVDAAALDGCERRGVVSEAAPGMLHVRPPATEQAIRESMSAARRSIVRQRLGELVELDPDPPDELLLRAASWSLDDGVRPAAGLAVAAAGAASRNGDYASARRLATAALDTEVDTEARLLLAHALRFSGQPAEARDLLDHLLSKDVRDRAAPDVLRQAVAARAQLQQYAFDDPAGAMAVLDAVGSDPGSFVTAHRLALLAFAARYDEVIDDMERLVDDPSSTDVERCVVWPGLIVGLAFVGRGRDALGHATRSLAAAPHVADQHPYAMNNVTSASFFARMLGGWGHEQLPSVGELAVTGLIQLGLGLPLVRNGRAAEAVVEIDKALAAFTVDDPNGFTALGLAAASAAAVLSGDEQRGVQLLEVARAAPMRISRSLEPEIENLLLWPEFFRGGVDHVASICRRLASDYERRSLSASALAIRHTGLRLGVTGLQPSVELLARVDTPAARAIGTQFAGLAAGDAAMLLDASMQFEQFGERVVAAEAAAQAHHEARNQGQRTIARTAALRIRALTDGIETVPYPLLRDWSAPQQLTPREREVATLAAQQLSNREIAKRLRASQRTVEAHLHRAYSKLGVADRTQLRTRLDDPPGNR